MALWHILKMMMLRKFLELRDRGVSMLEKLIKINDEMITQASTDKNKKKHLLIKKILDDKECFLKMNIETSYAILRELNIPEENLKNIYLDLISPANNA